MLNTTVLGNSLYSWGVALAISCFALTFVIVFKRVFVRRFVAFAGATDSRGHDLIAEILQETNTLLLAPSAVYLGLLALHLPGKTTTVIGYVAVTALLLQVALWGDRLSKSWFRRMRKEWDPSKATTMSLLGFGVRVFIWAMLVFIALDTLGFDITALIAGLGIGGIAIALAAQNILGDLFASLSIVLDKPFLIGDFIIVDDKLGTIEHIGIKTTRVRSLSGEQIVFSNADLLQSRIRNYKRMYERRVLFSLGVTYQTSADKLARIPVIIREIVEGCERTRFDRAHFHQFGDYALVFEVVYYVLDPDYHLYMDIHQTICLTIYRRFTEEGIDFAYPTHTVKLESASA